MSAAIPSVQLPTILCVALSAIAFTAAPARAADFTPPTEDQRLAALGSLDGEVSTVRRLLRPGNDFAPIEAPAPPDWLAMHEEPGQPYANFVLSDAQPVSETRRIIYLQPLGEFPADSAPSLEALRDYAAAFFQLDVVLLPADLTESAAFEPRINSSTRKPQLLSTAVLTWLHGRLPDDAYCLVAVTMSDLYPAPHWNFVYGQASPQHRTGVFSFVRHDPLFFGRERTDDFDAVMLQRSCKTLVHEIAHIFGLWHCIYFRCVENGVNHEAEGDSRPHHLCPICLRKLRYATGADLETRYRDLVYFFSQHSGWEAEDAWVKRQLARLRDTAPLRPSIAPVTPGPPAPAISLPPPMPPPPAVLPPNDIGTDNRDAAPKPEGPQILPPPAPPSPPSRDAATPPIPTPTTATEPLVAQAR